ncbi:hypothetical protein PM082_004065 [Marasmius tenuissimus]|nr:hypothetical protein PM082_004065 [Marasmius tenuissimus]
MLVASGSRGGPSPIIATPQSPSSQGEASTRHTEMSSGNGIRGQRYASLLSETSPGYPLWKPSPRCTDTGEEHIIQIGDVGVCSDVDPFLTLFNITEPLGHITDGDRVPAGVVPHCDIRGGITVDTGYHQNHKLFTKPPGSISHDVRIDEEDARIRVFTFNLSEEEDALLILPRGGVLRKLERTGEFQRRIVRHWRQWYDYADEEGVLDDRQTLCLLTGVEQCSTWAMAVWEPAPQRESRYIPNSLMLTLDGTHSNCSWGIPSPRCSTQSAPTLLGEDAALKETVFVRAFWIARNNGISHMRPPPSLPPPPPPDHDRDVDGNEDSSRHGRETRNPFNQFSQYSRDPSQNMNPFRKGSTLQSPQEAPMQPSPGCGDCFESSHNHIASEVQLTDQRHINISNIVSLPATFNTLSSHPCQLINELAFQIIGKAQPSLLELGCAAFSHDEDWISVLKDLEDGPLEEYGLLRRICGPNPSLA